MKATSAREAKNASGLMIGARRADLVWMEKHRSNVVVVAMEEYGRFTGKPMADRQTAQGQRKS